MGCCQSDTGNSPGDVIWAPTSKQERMSSFVSGLTNEDTYPATREHFEEIDLGYDEKQEVGLDEVALRDLDQAMDSLLDTSVALDDVQLPQTHPAPITELKSPSTALETRMSRISRRMSRISSVHSAHSVARHAAEEAVAEETESEFSQTNEDDTEGSFYDRVHEDEIQYQALALWSFEGNPDQWQISFEAGDLIGVIDAHPEEDWWIGAKDDAKGYFPRTYVEVIKKDIKGRGAVSDNIARLQNTLNL